MSTTIFCDQKLCDISAQEFSGPIIDSRDLHLYIDRPVNVEVVRKILNQTNIDPLESVANASTHADFEEHIKVKKIL